jgi:DNA primase large subunit
VYEITHSGQGVKKGDGLTGESVTHPNQYAAQSRALEKGVTKTEESGMAVD